MLTLYGETFPSRLLLGTAAYPTPEILKQSVQTARPAMITVSLRRMVRGFGRYWKKAASPCCRTQQAAKACRKR